jgi:hypothetical protein
VAAEFACRPLVMIRSQDWSTEEGAREVTTPYEYYELVLERDER